MNLKQGQHPYLPPHLQGLRGPRGNHVPFGPGSHTRLDIDSTMSVQGLRGALDNIPTANLVEANPQHAQIFAGGTYARVTHRTDGSGSEYVVYDAQGDVVRSGIVREGLDTTFVHGSLGPAMGWWRALPAWQRYALLGGGALLVVGGGYFAYRALRKKRRR